MLFNSYPFLLVYLPIVLSVFFGFSKMHLTRAAKGWLLLSSLFFYGYWDVHYLPLLAGSIIFNYGCGSWILSSKQPVLKKTFLISGIVGDLSLLFYFKYYNFFLSSVLGQSHQLMEVILPLGISFFTFTQIAYLVDTYQRKAEHCDVISYGLFVTIFPHLIAGPILHHKDMLKQFNSLRMHVLSWPNIAQGTFLFVMGMFKKVVIADNLAILAKPIFDQAKEAVPFVQAWFGAITYTLQLYFDFSGYSDMAVGLGLLFSLRLPINFNSPYQADSIIDFWRRWHMTLSQFLRDYLYISLGGNRYGKWSKLRNLFITMLLGGLWHGAGWTFVLWGACHGLFLIINHLWRDLKLNMPAWLARALTLLAVICAWVIFRAPTVDQALNILAGMAGFNGIVFPESYAQHLAFLKTLGIQFTHVAESKFRLRDLGLIFLLSVVVLIFPNTNYWVQRFKERPLAWAVACAFLFFISFLNLDEMSEFLYYQF
jgi:alginate O-acetyltransferase complex protein AlgI